jgi:L-amino acid N-acyltransferase YncA
MLPEHAAEVLAIFQAGIDGGNATFETAAPAWEVDHLVNSHVGSAQVPG